MYPFKHFVWAYFIGLGLMFTFPDLTVWQIVIFIAGATLIDVDHYFYYVYKKKNLNPMDAYFWFREQSLKSRNPFASKHILIFHGIEFLMLVLLISIWFHWARYLLMGVMLHITLDWVAEILIGLNILYGDKISQIKNWIVNKKKNAK